MNLAEQIMNLPVIPVDKRRDYGMGVDEGYRQALEAAAQLVREAQQSSPDTAQPLQGGLTNEELLKHWFSKLPHVKPSDDQLNAFALGVEVGRTPSRKHTDAELLKIYDDMDVALAANTTAPVHTDHGRHFDRTCPACVAEGETTPQVVAWRYETNSTHTHYSEVEPPDDAYDSGTLVPLYTATPKAPCRMLTEAEIDCLPVNSSDCVYPLDVERKFCEVNNLYPKETP